MTREEALKVLDTIPTIGEQVDALEMAIKALERDNSVLERVKMQEPCEDCVSRESMMVRVKEYFDNPSYDEKMLFDDLVNLPPVTPQPNAQQRDNEVLECVRMREPTPEERESVKKYIDSISTTIPQPRTGRWMHPYKSDIACECSECHIQMPITKNFNYCPNCGAKMEVEE